MKSCIKKIFLTDMRKIIRFSGLAVAFIAVIYLIGIVDLSYALNVPMRMSPIPVMGMSMGTVQMTGSASLNANAKGGSSMPSEVISERSSKNLNTFAAASVVCLQCQNIPAASINKILAYYTFQIHAASENYFHNNYVGYKIPHPPKSISL